MKTRFSLLTLAVGACAVLGSSDALAQAHAPIHMYASITKPIKVESVEEINFGALYSPSANGTVIITPDHTGLSENNALRSSSTILFQPHIRDKVADFDDHDGIEQGKVKVTGEVGYYYTLVAGPTTMSDGHGHTMTVDNVTFSRLFSGTYGHLLAGPNPAQGLEFVNIGATLHVNGGQASGNYAGLMNIQAIYN